MGRGASANPQPYPLPSLGLNLVYSRWQRASLAGEVIEGVGVAPDVPVDPPAGVLTAESPRAWAADTFDAALAHVQANALADGAPGACVAAGVDVGVAVGAAVGGAVGLLLVVGTLVWMVRRRRSSSGLPKKQQLDKSNDGTAL